MSWVEQLLVLLGLAVGVPLVLNLVFSRPGRGMYWRPTLPSSRLRAVLRTAQLLAAAGLVVTAVWWILVDDSWGLGWGAAPTAWGPGGRTGPQAASTAAVETAGVALVALVALELCLAMLWNPRREYDADEP